METYRRRLEAELKRLLEQAGATQDTVWSVMEAGCRLDGLGAGAIPDHLERAGRRVAVRTRQIAAALDRLDDGSYGLCTECGAEISPGRLAILPAATHCRRHTV